MAERRVALLRGINLGSTRRIPMPELRELFARAGFDDARTYVQSGNVVFSSDAPTVEPERARALSEMATEQERFVAFGRELYARHPDGVARSRLWAKLAGTGLAVGATARNWTTVTALLDMADGR